MKKYNNVSEFIRDYYERNPDGHFFDRETLKIFGETISTMKLLRKSEEITDIAGKKHTCYVLSAVQREPYGRRKRVYHYFDVDTLEDVII